MKIKPLILLQLLFIACNTKEAVVEPPLPPVINMEQSLKKLSLEYGYEYKVQSRVTNEIVSLLTFNSDTSLTEVFNGKTYKFYFSFGFNDLGLIATYFPKNKDAMYAFPFIPNVPVSWLARHQIIQISPLSSNIVVSGNYSYADPTNPFKFNLIK